MGEGVKICASTRGRQEKEQYRMLNLQISGMSQANAVGGLSQRRKGKVWIVDDGMECRNDNVRPSSSSSSSADCTSFSFYLIHRVYDYPTSLLTPSDFSCQLGTAQFHWEIIRIEINIDRSVVVTPGFLNPVPLVDQNPFSTLCRCGAPHLAWRSRGGYLDVPVNALNGFVLVTSFLGEKTHITSVLLWKKTRKNFLFTPWLYSNSRLLAWLPRCWTNSAMDEFYVVPGHVRPCNTTHQTHLSLGRLGCQPPYLRLRVCY